MAQGLIEVRSRESRVGLLVKYYFRKESILISRYTLLWSEEVSRSKGVIPQRTMYSSI